ncbi:hypothetical protein [Williamsia sp.]
MASVHVKDAPVIKLRIWRVLTLLGSLTAIVVGLVAIFMSGA